MQKEHSEQFIYFGEQRLNGKTNLEALLRIIEKWTEPSIVSVKSDLNLRGKMDNRINQDIVAYYIWAAGMDKCR